MRAADILRLSFINALRGRMRTSLTMVAIAIGVAATILVVAIGASARVAVSEQLDNIGISGIAIYPKKAASDIGVSLSSNDAIQVMSKVDGVTAAMPVVIRYGSYSIKNWRGNALVYGISEHLGSTLNLNILYGRLPTANDIKRGSRVVVVDDSLAYTVYSRTNIVGKSISLTVDGSMQEFEIIGVISSQSSGLSSLIGDALPSFMYIPYTSMANFSAAASKIEQLLVSVESQQALAQAIEVLNRQHNYENAFKFEDINGFRTQIDDVLIIISIFIAAIGAISMVVAGLGIMNSMLSTAIERRREVGIYMSLGARRRDIMFGFLAESGIISAVGGIAGVVLGLLLIAVIEKVSGYVVTIDLLVIVITEIAAIVCGLVFGVLPAVRASRLDPIEALRD